LILGLDLTSPQTVRHTAGDGRRVRRAHRPARPFARGAHGAVPKDSLDGGVFVALREKVEERDLVLVELGIEAQYAALAVRTLLALGEEANDLTVAEMLHWDIDDVRDAMEEINAAGWQPI